MAAYRHSFAMRCMLGSCCAIAAVALLLFFSGAANSLLGQTELSSSESLSPELREKLQKRGNLMLRDVTLVEAMFIIEQQWGVNIVIGNEAKEPVNGSYENAPLHEILDTLLGSRDYGYRIVGNSLVVLRRSEISELKPLFETARIPLEHVPPDQVTGLIDVLLSPGGRAHAVPSANSVIVMDYPDRIEEIRKRLKELDDAAADAKKKKDEEQRAAEEAAQQRANTTTVDPTTIGAHNTTPRVAVTNPGTSETEPTETTSPDAENSSQQDTTENINPDRGATSAPQDPSTESIGPSNTRPQPGANTYGPQNASIGASNSTTSGPLADVPLLERAYFRPQYVDAATIVASLATIVSEYGQVTAIPEENRIVAIDDHDHLLAIAEAVKELDCFRDQVRISALIFDASLEDVENIGVNLTNSFRGRNLSSNGTAQDQFNINTLLVPTPGANAVNGAFTVMSLSQNADITAVIRLLRQSNKSQLLADPTVVVEDRESARIAIVTEIPYQQLTESAQGGAIGTTAFREAGVTLQVTPRIAADGTVNLVVTPQFSVLTGFTEEDNQPIIARREAQTVVRVADQQTLVLGGLRQRSRVRNRAAIPTISNLPVVGRLFRQRNDELRESELLVFITPTIISADHFGTCREQRVHDRSRCELEKVREDSCYRCKPPEDLTIYSNQDFGNVPIYTDEGPSRNPAPFESMPSSKATTNNDGSQQNPVRLPASRRGNSFGNPNPNPVGPTIPEATLPPPNATVPETPTIPTTPTTSNRRNQINIAANTGPVIERALPVQEAQRAPVHPERSHQVSFPQAGKISSPPKDPAPAPVSEKPLPRFHAPPVRQKVNPQQAPGGMTRRIGRNRVIKVDNGKEERSANPKNDKSQSQPVKTLDGYFNL